MKPVALIVAASLLLAATAAHAQMTLPGKFEVTDTGSASYTIPISIVPGTAGLEPKLSLQYDSRAGNGLLGVGWSLAGLPAITRCGKTIAQDGAVGGVSYDANDRFCLDGQRLIAISGAYGADQTEYRTERESFSKVVSYGSAGSGPSWFKVWTKAGLVMEFGNTADSKIEAQGKASVRVWALNRTSDTKGNYFTVSYTEDNANGEYRPDRIDYTGNVTANTQPANSARFVYETRPDIVPLYQAGSLINTTQRMTKVQAWQGESVVKEYKFSFDDAGPARRSRMIDAAFCITETECLYHRAFAWSATIHAVSAEQLVLPSFGTANGYANMDTHPRYFVDVNGDGLTDVVGIASDGVYVSLSTGTGFTAPTQWLAGFGVNSTWSSNSLYPRTFADVNGDGLPDLMAVGAGAAYAVINTGSSFADAFYVLGFGTANGYANMDTHPRYFVDVNGDGLTDVVGIASDGVYVSLSTGTGFTAPTQWLAGFGVNSTWSSNSTNPRTFADVNGDGLPDIVGIGAGAAYVAYNTGASFQLPPVWTMGYGTSSGWSDSSVRPREIVDVNGDGLPDIIGFASDGVHMSGNLSIVGDLLTSVSGGEGSITKIDRSPLSKGGTYIKDAGISACAYPCVDVQGPLYVVSEVKSSNGLGIAGAGGEYRSTYRYAGAKSNLHGRGFLGFRQMTVRDEQTGVEQVTTYRQDYPFTGLVASREKKLGAQLLNRSSNTYGSTNLGGTRRYPFLTQSLEESWELNGAALPAVTTSYQYDAWGNATQVGVSTGDGHAKTTVNTYSNDTANWLLGRLTRSEVTSTTPGN